MTDVLSVRCPFCGVEPGERCKKSNDKVYRKSHLDRHKAAKETESIAKLSVTSIANSHGDRRRPKQPLVFVSYLPYSLGIDVASFYFMPQQADEICRLIKLAARRAKRGAYDKSFEIDLRDE